MATITQRTDDITGDILPEETPTTRIYVEDPRGDVSVEIDLSEVSFKGLEKALSKYTAKARPITPAQSKSGSTDATEAAAARAWGLAHPDLLPDGVKANERGKVSGAVIDAYRAFIAEHGKTVTLDAES